jgi:hypothetical protein
MNNTFLTKKKVEFNIFRKKVTPNISRESRSKSAFFFDSDETSGGGKQFRLAGGWCWFILRENYC